MSQQIDAALEELLASPEKPKTQEEQVSEAPEISEAPEEDDDDEVADLIADRSFKFKPSLELDDSSFLPRLSRNSMHVKSNHLIKKKLSLTKRQFGTISVYSMTAGSRVFDSLLRRSPKEVLPVELPVEIYPIPLGGSCAQACVSLYGLTNYELYGWKVWHEVMKNFVSAQTEENVGNVITLLRASAVKKVLTVSAAESNLVRGFDLESLYLALSIDDARITSYFFDMLL